MEQNILLEEIIKKFDLYKKQQITYDEFLNMYNKYRDKLTEVEFANLLGVKKKSFNDFKRKQKENKNKKLTILSNRHLTVEEENKKMLDLVEKYNLFKGKKISYGIFKEMHEEVKTVLTEVEFANELGISDSNLRHIRNPKEEARIFKNCKLNDEITERIRKHILIQYEGKKTYYESNENNKGEVDFLELYKPYRIYFSEKEFAELLGISEKNLWYIKHKMWNPKIKDIEKIKKIETIKGNLEKFICLRKDEIEVICKKLDISVEDFITYYINKGKVFDYSVYKQALDTNNMLWLKQGKVNKEYIQKYSEMFLRIAKSTAINVKNKYTKQKYEEDLQYKTLLYILENCQDLISNFKYDEKLMEKMIWFRARQYAKNIYIMEEKENKRVSMLYKDEVAVKSKGEIINNKIDDDIELERLEELEYTEDEQLVDIFKNYLVQGYSKEEILKKLSIILNIDKIEILDRMKNCLLEKGQVKQNDEGDYEIGEY